MKRPNCSDLESVLVQSIPLHMFDSSSGRFPVVLVFNATRAKFPGLDSAVCQDMSVLVLLLINSTDLEAALHVTTHPTGQMHAAVDSICFQIV
jgi:hypothetical protein